MSLGTVYISSRGLKKASRYQIGAIDIDWQYQNEFCKIKDIKVSECDSDTLISLMKLNDF